VPTYEYQCTVCETVMEEFHSITAKAKRKLNCPKCKKSSPVKRLIGIGSGVLFKGDGFYQTDYRSEGYKSDAKAAAEAAKPKDSSSKDKKGDSKKTPAKKEGSSKKKDA